MVAYHEFLQSYIMFGIDLMIIMMTRFLQIKLAVIYFPSI